MNHWAKGIELSASNDEIEKHIQNKKRNKKMSKALKDKKGSASNQEQIFKELSEKAIHLIYDGADKNNIPHEVMASAACAYIKAISLALKIPYKEYSKTITALLGGYDELLKKYSDD